MLPSLQLPPGRTGSIPGNLRGYVPDTPQNRLLRPNPQPSSPDLRTHAIKALSRGNRDWEEKFAKVLTDDPNNWQMPPIQDLYIQGAYFNFGETPGTIPNQKSRVQLPPGSQPTQFTMSSSSPTGIDTISSSSGALWGNLGEGPLGYNWNINGLQTSNVYVPGYFGGQPPVIGIPEIIPPQQFQRDFLAGLDVFWQTFPTFEETYRRYRDAAIGNIEAKLGSFIVPRLILCQPAGTPVLTSRGFIDISEMRVGDQVLTHTGKWATVSSTRSRMHSGEMLSLSIAGHLDPVRMTPEHRVWATQTTPCIRTGAACRAPCREAIGTSDGRTKGRGCPAKFFLDYEENFVEAHHLKVGDIISHPIDMTTLTAQELEDEMAAVCGNSVAVSDIAVRDGTTGRVVATTHGFRAPKPEEVEFAQHPDFWRLAGYFLGDGTMTPHGVSFSFGPSESHIVNDVVDIAESVLGRKGTRWYTSNVRGVNISLSMATPFFKSLYYGNRPGQKRPLSWMEHLPLEHQKQMLKGYWLADGNSKKDKNGSVSSYMIVSVAKPMLESFQRIGWRLGLISTIGLMRPAGHSVMMGKEVSQQPLYSLVFGRDFSDVILDTPNPSPRPMRRKQWIEAQRIYSLITRIEVEAPHDERVYNFTVDHPDHSYTGLHVATHNCDGVERGYRPGVDFDLEEREYDFNAQEFYNWGFTQLRYTPVMSIIQMTLVYPTGQVILALPPSWIENAWSTLNSVKREILAA